MEKRRGWMFLILLVAFAIFSIGMVSSAACYVTTYPCPSSYPYVVMKLSSITNAHGALYNQGSYTSALCCDFSGTNTCDSSGTNVVLRLSAPTNAHAELRTEVNYPSADRVCFGALTCTSTTSSSCPASYPMQMVSLSATTNAHLAQFSTYSTKICCDPNLVTCGDGIVNSPEVCDGSNLNGKTCLTQGYAGGTLACAANCLSFNTAGCCNNDCSAGAKQCSGSSSYQNCVTNYDSDPCYEWGAVTSCPTYPNTVASCSGSGVCSASCTSSYEYCDGSATDADGCECPINGYHCSGSSCVVDCTNECTQGTTKCSGSLVQTCIMGSSGCTVWGTATSCPSGETCSGSSCVLACTNQCTQGTTKCSGSLVQTCIMGSSGCTVWGTATSCPSGETCSGNQCVCVPTKTTCSSSECGNIWNGCGYINCDGCSVGTCVGTTCQCTSTSELECSGGNLWSVDSCGNLDEVVESCNKGGGSCYSYYCSGDSCRSDYICECSSNGDCNDNKLCTTDSCSGGSCVYTDKVCGVDNDGCCQPGCTYPNDQDCPPPVADCPDGLINQAWEECDCGTDGTCTSAELGGETCSSLDSRYTGGVLGCSYCQFITTGCTLPCDLTEAYWSTTSTYVGNEVSLIVTGSSSCNGKTINFEVWKDALIDTRVTTLSGRTMSSGSVTTTWTPTETSPNNGYYFVAEASDGSDDIESDRLEVLENSGCWDGTCDASAGENCATCPDDCGSCCGNSVCDSNECVTCPGDCTNCPLPCGDGTCDDTIGETCYTCEADCDVCPSPECGDGNLDAGEACDDGNTVSGDGCSAYCEIEEIPGGEECEITSAAWNDSYVLEGEQVKLNFQATNCNGKTITFFVLEKDDGVMGVGGGDDNVVTEPAPIVYNSPSTYGIWTAEGQEDNDESLGESYPPEYYFRVVVDNEEKAESSNEDTEDPLLLKVGSQDTACSGISYCVNYNNQQDCESDICTIGVDSAVGISCGSEYDPLTDCWNNINCGCTWDSVSETCAASWEAESVCGGTEGVCVEDYDVNECWLAGDLCTDECECFGISVPNTYGSCDYYGTGICDEDYDECWLAGDLCTDECECFGTSIPDGYGSCFDNPDAVCVEDYDVNECWLAGDHCTDDCICETGYDANGDGTCGDFNPDVCVPNEDECWLMGDACQSDCTCFGTSIPDGYGACVDDAFAVCIPYVHECWLAGDLCTDECECVGTSVPNTYGSCDYYGTGICDEDYDECWLAGDHCEDDCTCENGYEPNGEGACLGGEGTEGVIRKKGTCVYNEIGDDDCSDNYLDRILNAIWQWDSNNNYPEIPSGEDEANFVMDVESGVYRYDPLRQSLLCVDIQDRFACPAAVEVPFFGVYQLAIVIAIVGLIYLLYVLRKKSHHKSPDKKKRKIKRKK